MSVELFSDPTMQKGWKRDHPQPEIATHVLTPSQRMEKVRQIRIDHPAYKNAIAFVKGTYEKSGKYDDPGGGRIIAEAGCGKSSIRDLMLEEHPPDDLPEYLHLPVLSIDAYVGVQIGSFLDSMLGKTSSVLASGKTSDDSIRAKVNTLIQALKICKTRLIMVDEFQHLGERKQGVLSKQVTDQCKVIYSATHIPMIFLGELNADLPFDQNPQFRSRFPARIQLHRFEWDMEFLGVLQSFDQQLPMEYQAGLANENIAFAIHSVTEGRMRILVKLLSEAVYYATDAGAQRVGVKHLARAFDSIFAADPKVTNPFASLKDS